MLSVVAIGALLGCQSTARVPPPATGAMQPPNPYYQQPPTVPPFTPPTYGAPGVAPTAGAHSAPSFAPPPNLASNSGSGALNWQPATTAASPTMNPKTTLTSIRTPTGAPSTANNGQLTEISQLPLASVPPTTNAYGAQPGVAPSIPPATAPLQTTPVGYPGYAPPPAFNIPPLGFGPGPTMNNSDPWRGR
jgi:hypothetical protein